MALTIGHHVDEEGLAHFGLARAFVGVPLTVQVSCPRKRASPADVKWRSPLSRG